MKAIKQGDYPALIAEIGLAAPAKLTDDHITALTMAFMAVPWSVALSAATGYVGMPNPPRNTYGHLVTSLDEIDAARKRSAMRATYWVAEDGCMSPEEWESGAALMTEMMTWHVQGLVKCRPDAPVQAPITVDEWERQGKPQTVSPLADWWMSGYTAAANAGTLAQYNRDCLAKLRAEREKRTAAISAERKAQAKELQTA